MSIISLFVLGGLIFVSEYFLYAGSLFPGFVYAIVIPVVLLILLGVLVRIKKVSIPLCFQKYATIEVGLIAAIVLIALYSITVFNHYFTVVGRTDQITGKLNTQLSQTSAMYDDYNNYAANRTANYERWLKQVESNKYFDMASYISAGFNRPNVTVSMLVNDFNADITSPAVVKEASLKWVGEIQKKANGWGLILLMPRVKEIQTELEKQKAELVTKDKSRNEGRNDKGWSFNLQFDDLLSGFTSKGDLNGLSFVAGVMILFFYLLPYLAVKRDGRHKGLFIELLKNKKEADSSREDYI